MAVQLTAGEPLKSPTLSILFAPGVTAGEASEVCLDEWQVDAVTVVGHESDGGHQENSLEAMRFTCQIKDVAETASTRMIIPIIMSKGASQRALSATVGVKSGAVALETVAVPITDADVARTVCDPTGLATAGSDDKETTPYLANGTVSGLVADRSQDSTPVVQLVGIDSCNHWISRAVSVSPDGAFVFTGLLPGEYALGLRDAAISTPVALKSESMNVIDLTI
ncbi:hypothetical protein [Rhodococcus sp. 1168]|uniref:hypothetical protein n=1 Tax=Rhodococcus sp. 1168 TaxID=2018041 RepID=UPI000F73E5F1|nr:hypothetical protein [Rhodococcus sp. 1168]